MCSRVGGLPAPPVRVAPLWGEVGDGLGRLVWPWECARLRPPVDGGCGGLKSERERHTEIIRKYYQNNYGHFWAIYGENVFK